MTSKAFYQGKTKSLLGLMLIFGLLVSLLMSIFGSNSVSAAGVTVTRTLPSTVIRGQTFNVMITFTSPDNNFNAIGLSDFVPSGWTIAANNTWSNPDSDTFNISGNRIDYIWNGPFPSGEMFTAVYQVTVPLNATTGTYSFSNLSPAPRLEYYVAATGPFTDVVVGTNSLGVPSNAAEILTYTIPGQVGSTSINNAASTVTIHMPFAADVSNLIASFTTSPAVISVKVGGIDQISGVTVNNYINPVIYSITAEDGVTTRDWRVTITAGENIPASSNLALGLLIAVFATLLVFFAYRRLRRFQNYM